MTLDFLWCRAFKFVLFVFAITSSVAFLVIATFQSLRHGPKTNSLLLHLSSLNFPDLDPNNVSSRGLEIGPWHANLVFINPKLYQNITITPFDAYIAYQGFPIACGKMNETLTIGPGREVLGEVGDKSQGCDWQRQIQGPFTAKLASELIENKRVNMSLSMEFRAYYKHGSWGWDVKLEPYCENLNIEFDRGTNSYRFRGNGASACKVPSNFWFK